MDEMSPHVRLALDSITAYIVRGETILPPDGCPPDLASPAAAFVSLKKYGELRGCIGTIEPVHPTLAHEIIHNAISASTRDPRFLPVEPEELELLMCSVDVLTKPEPVDDICCLHPAQYGVIVECGTRRGLLLPDLEGVDTVEDQISIACRKATIRPGEPVCLYRFEVKRYY
jgi:AmmeMemoRadiSam system protein A